MALIKKNLFDEYIDTLVINTETDMDEDDLFQEEFFWLKYHWYILVVGRRDRMDNHVNQMCRKMLRESIGLKNITYDRLVNSLRLLSKGY